MEAARRRSSKQEAGGHHEDEAWRQNTAAGEAVSPSPQLPYHRSTRTVVCQRLAGDSDVLALEEKEAAGADAFLEQRPHPCSAISHLPP